MKRSPFHRQPYYRRAQTGSGLHARAGFPPAVQIRLSWCGLHVGAFISLWWPPADRRMTWKPPISIPWGLTARRGKDCASDVTIC